MTEVATATMNVWNQITTIATPFSLIQSSL